MRTQSRALWILGATSPNSLNPTRLLNQKLSTRAPESIYAGPMFAALLLLAAVARGRRTAARDQRL